MAWGWVREGVVSRRSRHCVCPGSHRQSWAVTMTVCCDGGNPGCCGSRPAAEWEGVTGETGRMGGFSLEEGRGGVDRCRVGRRPFQVEETARANM